METTISPILGLTLLELVEYLGIIGPLIVAVAIAISIWANDRISNRSLRQTEQYAKHTNKVESARLVIELKKPWTFKKFKKFLSVFDDLENEFKSDRKERRKRQLEEFFNQMEDIAVFWRDGTLEEFHVKEFFGANLKNINKNQFVLEQLATLRKPNPNYYFVNLAALLKEAKKWNI